MRTKAKLLRFTSRADLLAEGFRFLKVKRGKVSASLLDCVFSAVTFVMADSNNPVGLLSAANRLGEALREDPEIADLIKHVARHRKKVTFLTNAQRSHQSVTVMAKGKAVPVPIDEALDKEITDFLQQRYPQQPITLSGVTKSRLRMAKSDEKRYPVYFKAYVAVAAYWTENWKKRNPSDHLEPVRGPRTHQCADNLLVLVPGVYISGIL